MTTYDAVLGELVTLSSEALARVYDALHDLKDGGLHCAIMDLLWERHGESSTWPCLWQDIGSATPGPARHHLVVRHCHRGTSDKDPDHQVRRHLAWSYQDDRGTRAFDEYECTCGGRTDRTSPIGQAIFLRPRQAQASALVWPTVMRDGVPHFWICQFARSADDPEHAPGAYGSSCLCTARLGEDVAKVLPCY